MSICSNCRYAKEMKQGKKIMYWCSVFKGLFNATRSSCDKYENKEK